MNVAELHREKRLLRQENERLKSLVAEQSENDEDRDELVVSESRHNGDDMGQPERLQMRAEDKRLVLADCYSKMVLFVCDHFPGEVRQILGNIRVCIGNNDAVGTLWENMCAQEMSDEHKTRIIHEFRN